MELVPEASSERDEKFTRATKGNIGAGAELA